MIRRDNLQRQMKLVQGGDDAAYDDYLRSMLRGRADPDWQALFGYWMSKPCGTCKGQGFVPDPLLILIHSPPCGACNGLKCTTLTDAMVLHLVFPPVVMTDNAPAPHGLIFHAAQLAWAFLATTDFSFRASRSIRMGEMNTAVKPAARFSYALVRFYNTHSLRFLNNHGSSMVFLSGIKLALAAGLIAYDNENYYVPRNTSQPRLRMLEVMRAMTTHRTNLPMLKRYHWIVRYVYQKGRINSVRRVDSTGRFARFDKRYRHIPGTLE